jgi:hypothetical protein
VPWQSESLAGQNAAHTPVTQTSVDLHALPQVPQFALSVCVSAHLPVHATCGALHSEAQAPFVQVSDAPHAFPQAPQFAVSVCVLVHVWPHVVNGVGQVPTTGSSPVQAMIVTAAAENANAAHPTHFAVRTIVELLS